MTDLYRARVALAGWEGAPGVNTFYYTGGTLGSLDPENVVLQANVELGAIMTRLAKYMVAGMTWEVESDVDVIDSDTGNIVNVVVQTEQFQSGASTGTESTRLSRATMLLVAHQTNTWMNGRRLQGRSFIGPINQDPLTNNGQLSPGAITDINDAFIALTTGVGPRLAVYHRPTNGQANGFYADVARSVCRTKPATLRSRRD